MPRPEQTWPRLGLLSRHGFVVVSNIYSASSRRLNSGEAAPAKKTLHQAYLSIQEAIAIVTMSLEKIKNKFLNALLLVY